MTFVQRKVMIISVPKAGKDPTHHANYRHICKTMDRMINRTLVCYLESYKFLTNIQCGFRSRHNTVDHLVRFETFCILSN